MKDGPDRDGGDSSAQCPPGTQEESKWHWDLILAKTVPRAFYPDVGHGLSEAEKSVQRRETDSRRRELSMCLSHHTSVSAANSACHFCTS